MRYKYSLIPALLIGFLLICSFKAAETFSRSGISFNIPNDWTITELEKLDEESYYLSCEKSGSNASGLVTMTWMSSEMGTEETVQHFANELKKTYKEQNADPRMSAVMKGIYQTYQCARVTYSLKLMGTPHRGTISCFQLCGKTITILEQEADEDAAENAPGFKTIEQSFRCKN